METFFIKKYLKNKFYYQARLEHVVNQIQWDFTSVLDLGSGELIFKDIARKKGKIIQYIGVDQYKYSDDPDFIQSDILDESLFRDTKFDIILCLGVMDHFELNQCEKLVALYKPKCKKMFILNQSNPRSILNLILGLKSTSFIDVEKSMGKPAFMKMHFIKIPMTQAFFKITNSSFFNKYLATETVYYFSVNEP
ncbi:MAG: class I SAM-dependent methyltransferase [Bacteroidota bacterium]|nr:class I SAM-dependent methyltransferase [Bacteroidota bacterium]